MSDWKGAALIRSVPRNPYAGNGNKPGWASGARPKRRPTCAVPGCLRQLGNQNHSGVCRDHVHSEWCACAPCAAKKAKP